jgi:hypothetical protein
MGTHVYIANGLNQDVYVIPSQKPEWMLADLGFNVALLMMGLIELKSAIGLADLPQTVRTVDNLWQFATVLIDLGIKRVYPLANRVKVIADQMMDQFRAVSLKVPAGQCVDVLNLSSFSNYTSLSGNFSQFLNVSTFHILAVTDDGKNVAFGNTGSDHSWIIQEDRMVRSLYGGSVWLEDPHSGTILFNIGDFVPHGDYKCSCKDIKVMLTCKPRANNGTPCYGVSVDLTMARGDISFSNINGSLVVDNMRARSKGFVPGGTYTDSTLDIMVQLTCKAQKLDGSWQPASLNLTNLRYENVMPLVRNKDGVLEVEYRTLIDWTRWRPGIPY